MDQLDLNKLPRHVAIIMDGNGRWAQKKLRNRIRGHEEGAESGREVVRCCRKLGIPYLTLYAFSKENWQRPKSEIDALWQLLKRFLKSELSELIQKEIRLNHFGDIEGIPEDVVREIQNAAQQTAHLDKLVLNLAINYGGRQEIIRGAARFAEDVQRGKRRPHDLTPGLFTKYLFSEDIPDPDLLIRTSGEYRISNFLLWQIAYTEIYITDVLWPDFREHHFMNALIDYQARDRRFGKTGEQIQSKLDANSQKSDTRNS
jgi:undecaprenyl diphosphate synthase